MVDGRWMMSWWLFYWLTDSKTVRIGRDDKDKNSGIH